MNLWSSLQSLDLISNYLLVGTLMSEIGTLSALMSLNIDSSLGLSGTFPTQFGQLHNMQELRISNLPAVSGSIPPELAQWSNLRYLSLSSLSKLSGTFPSQIGVWTDLLTMYLLDSPLVEGELPTATIWLSHIQNLAVSNTRISGTITATFLNCSALADLQLDYNLLSGGLPDFSSITTLTSLSLKSNRCSLYLTTVVLEVLLNVSSINEHASSLKHHHESLHS